MRCCDGGEPVKVETSEAGPVSFLEFCSMTVRWEATCGLYIWRTPKYRHTRFASIQGAMSFPTLKFMLSVHRKQVQARFQGEKLRGEGVDVYTAPELLMRELTSSPATRQGGWVGELRRRPSQSLASSARTAWVSGQLSVRTHQRSRNQKSSWTTWGK